MFFAPFSSFARPADVNEYTAADLVANNPAAGAVVPLRFGRERVNGAGPVKSELVFSDHQVVTLASFNVHIFTAPPVVTNGDNGVFAVADATGYLGSIACDLATGAFVTVTDKAKRFPAGGAGFAFVLP